MKLLSLNVWDACQGQVLFDYLHKQSATTDIFCFQEVFDTATGIAEHEGMRPNLFNQLKAALPGFTGFFNEDYRGWDTINMKKASFDMAEGQAMFVRNGIGVLDTGAVPVYGSAADEMKPDFSNEPKAMQYAVLEVSGKRLLVANVHGMWHPGTKLDTPERLEQSRVIKNFVSAFNGPKIVCGDFNLELNTQSIAMFEPELRNLIKEFNITNTRNEIAWSKFPEEQKQHYADFTLVSSDVRVTAFEVPYNLVSDHLPMVLEFMLQ